MEILLWVLLGVAAGVAAGFIAEQYEWGAKKDIPYYIIAGIVGGFFGGWSGMGFAALTFNFNFSDFGYLTILTSLVGSVGITALIVWLKHKYLD